MKQNQLQSEVGGSPQVSPTQPAPDVLKIACVGDSITRGTFVWRRKKRSYPAQLQAILGERFCVRNFGVNGHAVQKSADRPYWNSEAFALSCSFEPDVVLIMLGTNDSRGDNWKGVGPFSTDYRKLTEHYQSLEPSPRVWLLTPPALFRLGRSTKVRYGMKEPAIREMCGAIKSLARELGCSVIDVNEVTAHHPEAFRFDGVHPGGAGATLIAQAVHEALVRTKTTPQRPETKNPDAVDLVVWSGTGNTLHVAERIAEAARSQGAIARVSSVTSGARGGLAGRRLLGLLSPTHGFTAPWPIVIAAFTQPNVRGTEAFVLVTRGGTRVLGRNLAGFEGTAAYLPAAILAARGARVRGVGAIDMPLNWTVAVPSFSPESVAEIVGRGDAQTDEFAGRLLSGQTAYGGLAQLLLGILMLPLSLGYMLIARLVLAKMFYADERCTSCGTCERRCPQGAVRLKGWQRRPYWTYDCQNCMRCMSECPTEAIQGGQGWLLLYIWLIALPVAGWATASMSQALGVDGALTSSVIRLVAGYAWIAASVWIAYALLWLGLLVPGVRLVLSRATFTRLYRRYRGPEGPAGCP